MPDYCYSSLQPNSIRLFQLLPSEKDSDPLQGELFEYPLGTDRAFYPYESLSYVWGCESKPQSISIKGHNLEITKSLYDALTHLRYNGGPRWLWIDAICINQANVAEKTQQIPLMAEIYAFAIRVIAWLGTAEDDGDKALETLRLAAAEIKNTSPANQGNLPYEEVARLHTDAAKLSITRLLQRQWFQRIWVRC
jgi:hypothetical protein